MNIRKYVSNMRDVDSDDVLGLIGLQRRSSGDWIFPMLAGVGAGLAIGAGLALLLTPYRGEEMRERLRRGASDAQRMLNERADEVSEKVSEKLNEMKPNVTSARTVPVGGSNIPGGNRGY